MLITLDELARFGARPTGILHLGAHTGEEAGAYHRAGVARVLWFEANPRVVPALAAHLAAFPEQRWAQVAVSDTDDGVVEFRIADNGQSSSLLPMKRHRVRYPDIHEVETIRVTTITVDTHLARAGLSPSDYDFANLDLQGGEALALRGMARCLRHLRWVYTEVNFEELYLGCPLVGDLDALLGGSGFERVTTADTGYGWGDALYVRRSAPAETGS